MSRIQAGLRVFALVAACATAAMADAPVEEAPGSDIRVGITAALEGFGFELQEAHEIAVLVTDGIDLGSTQTSCLVYLVTMWWCEVVDGTVTMRVTRLRAPVECFTTFFPPSGPCLLPSCASGSVPLYAIRTGVACGSKPGGVCAFVEISGPVVSSCVGVLPCTCVDEFSETTCEAVVVCVPVVGEPPWVVPEVCPDGCD